MTTAAGQPRGMGNAATVAALWRYPVKSVRGERLDALLLTPRGALGDRAYALIDTETGTVASAKRSRVWGGLFACSARYAESFGGAAGDDGEPPPVRITLPDGAAVTSTDPDRDERLSAAFGRPVRLAQRPPAAARLRVEGEPALGGGEIGEFRLPAGLFVDSAPLHLLTTATLAALRRRYPEGRFDPRRFRPNLLLRTPPEADDRLAEDVWLGRELRVGAATLRVTRPTGRCIMTTLAQDDLPHDPGIMRTLLAHNDACAGVYAEVLRPGEVRAGDPVELI